MGRVVRVILLFLSAFALLWGCSAREEPGETVEEKRIQIGMSFDSFVIERWQKDRDVFVATARELGADVNVQTANGDLEEQVRQIKYFIEKKMDVIVIIATDSFRLAEPVREAREAGIKVVAYDRLIRDGDVDLYISFDNEEVGRLMARTLMDKNPEGGSIIAIYGPMTDNNVAIVVKEFTRLIWDSNLRIIHHSYSKGWLAENAFSQVNAGLALDPDVGGVMCGNDDLATQAVRALAEKRLAGKVTLVGQDADLLACQRIVEGTQDMTVYKPMQELAKKAACYAVALGKGEDIQVSDTIYDGSYNVPYESLRPVAITRDNLDDIIIRRDGFHLKEDVYLNVPYPKEETDMKGH